MEKGDFIKIDFVGRVIASGEIFDLTIEEVAKKEGIFSEKHKYGPTLVVMGANMVIPGVEKRLEQMKVGDEREFDLSAEDGFGKRDPKNIKIFSLSNFTKQKMNPAPGMFVTINGKQAKIQNVTGGRVRVDFNHPLAGRELHYRVRITDQLKNKLEKSKAMIEYYGIKAEAKIEDNKLHIHTVKPLPDVVQKIIEDKMKEWIKEIKSIKFLSKEKEKKEEKKEEKGEETAPGSVSLERPEESE